MPIALITDTHLGARNNCTVFNEHFLRFFSEVFFPTLKSRNISTVIHLGDLGEYKRTINTLILDSWNKHVFKPLQSYQVWMLCGNHDFFYKHRNNVSLQTSLELEDRFGFKVISHFPETLKLEGTHLDLVPWISSANYDDVVSYIGKSSSPYLLGHLEFSGALMIPGILCTESQLSYKLTEKYKRIMSGHFHHRSEKGNVTYIGNPYEIIWSDVNQPRGFALFYPKTNQIEYINNPFSIFLKLYVTQQSDIDTLDVSCCARKHVKLYVSSLLRSVDIERLVSSIEHQAPLSLIVQDAKLDIESTEMDPEQEFPDTLFYIKNFVDKLYNHQNLHLDKGRLVQKLEQIYTLAQSLGT